MAQERADDSSTEDLGIPLGLNIIKRRPRSFKEENQANLIPSAISFTGLKISSTVEKWKDAKEENLLWWYRHNCDEISKFELNCMHYLRGTTDLVCWGMACNELDARVFVPPPMRMNWSF
ncbi:hypothetical protein SUGI_0268720 [Cryptomeria japonica]|nr:hypothetical protein SUGI_0268720 [Cryptomeria japonica]